MSARIIPFFEKVTETFSYLVIDPPTQAAARRAFAEAARTAAVEVYRGPLDADVALWSHCAAQWGAGPGFKGRVERIIRDWFEAQTGLNQKLEGVMAALWEETVVRPLERLSDESAGELPEDIRPTDVVPFARRVSA